MDDGKLEETIKGIEYCMGSNAPDDCEHCPGQYICGDSIMQENFVDLPKSMINNALELLKEQQKIIEDKQDIIEILEDQVSMLQE